MVTPCGSGTVFVLLVLSWSSFSDSRSIPDIDKPVDYSGYRVLRVHPVTERQKNIFRFYYTEGTDPGVTLWTEPLTVDHAMDFLVSRDAVSRFMHRIHREKVPFEVLINDLQGLIEEQKRESGEYKRDAKQRNRRRRSVSSNQDNTAGTESDVGGFFADLLELVPLLEEEEEEEIDLSDITNRYATYTEISNWLQLVAGKYPTISKVMEIGTSYNGRALQVIKIGKPRNSTKNAIWIDAGIHAREWISPATAIYIINTLLSEYEKDPIVAKLVEEFDWFILPLTNPDGYEYSHTTDRLWRKTRSRVATLRKNCAGVDANRNFDFRWQNECTGRSYCRGRLPCSDVFAGNRPFSEPETIAVANFILKHKDLIKMYISFHSYSQLWLLPWGYTRQHPTDYEDLRRLSEKAVNALKVPYNTSYSIGTPAELLYPATGGSYDWAKGVAGIKYSFTMELRDKGNYGFLLPHHQIQPTGKETWAAVQKSVAELKQDTCWMDKTGC